MRECGKRAMLSVDTDSYSQKPTRRWSPMPTSAAGRASTASPRTP